MFSFFKKRSVYISLIVIIVLVLISFFAFSSKKGPGEVISVTRGDIIQEVFITGTVKTDKKVSLSFDRGGSISSLPYSVGSTVAHGSVLASLQNETEAAAVAEQKAAVAIKEAKLAKIHKGTRAEEISLKEAEARKAEVSLQNDLSKLGTVLADSYSAAEEALSRYAAPFFSNDDTTTPRLTYSSGTQNAYDAEAKRLQAGISVKKLQELFADTRPSTLSLVSAITEMRVVQNLFVTLGLTLRDDSNLDTATLTDYRGRVTSARSALTTAINAAQNQLNTIRDDAAEFDRTKRALELAQALATPETIQEAEQELLQSEAKLRGTVAALEKTLLRAPFTGQISSKNAEIGETVSSGKAIMEFLSTNAYTIEANVPEADITKIVKGDSAEVTLDAYGDSLTFSARVIEIEPAATEIEGVSTYKTTFSIDNTDTRVRSGMTANVTIKKMLRKDALVIPLRAITTEGGVSSVSKVLPNGEAKKIPVSLGSRNNTREVEVTEGLKEGDAVVMPEVK